MCVDCFNNNVMQSYSAYLREKSKSDPFVKRTDDNYYDGGRADFHSTRFVESVMSTESWTQRLRSSYRYMRPLDTRWANATGNYQ